MENPTSDEKILATFAHGSVLLSFLGPIGATVIWVLQRNKSKYVRYHALQAMGYQAFSLWIWFISMFVFVFGIVGISIILAMATNDAPSMHPEAIFFIQPLLMLVIFGLWGLIFLIGFIGGVFCMLGKEFRYPIMGSWLHRKLFNEQNTEEEIEKWEDYWVGSVCHATAIIQMWGLITPFIVWFSQKDRSVWLRFQALQAAIYQLLATVAYILSTAGFMFIYFIFIGMLIMSGTLSHSSQAVSPVSGGFAIIMIVILFLLWLAWMILYPLYYILAGIATIRTMRGHDFKYPILGRIMAKRMAIPKS